VNTGTAGLILHLDDERSVRESLSLLLRADGYQVSSAASGPEALQLASRGLRPDVLIVDFNLDRQMNGAEAAEQLRKVLNYATPIIVLTGDVSNAQSPFTTEVPVWLARKPLDPRLLLAALPSLVQLSRATRKLLTRSP
jgi:CheY-like chemotaxis protein